MYAGFDYLEGLEFSGVMLRVRSARIRSTSPPPIIVVNVHDVDLCLIHFEFSDGGIGYGSVGHGDDYSASIDMSETGSLVRLVGQSLRPHRSWNCRSPAKPVMSI